MVLRMVLEPLIVARPPPWLAPGCPLLGLLFPVPALPPRAWFPLSVVEVTVMVPALAMPPPLPIAPLPPPKFGFEPPAPPAALLPEKVQLLMDKLPALSL